jgi:uncharacterized protein (TIGR03545 family)
MSRFLRWQGLVGFATIAALIVIFVYLFADSLVKKGVEKSGEWYLGAEVNVESVVITYSPLTLNIKGFQATDPEKPTHNLVSFSQASAGVDVWQYLFGKLYISELNILELRLDQLRESKGAVFTLTDENAEKDSTKSENAILPKLDMSLPKVDELLNNSDLLTIKNGKALESSYQVEKQKLKDIQKKLPDKETLANYKKQIKALGNTKIKTLADIEKLNKDFQALKKQFKVDQDIVKQAQQQVASSKTLLIKQTKILKSSPTADWKIIEDKYQLDNVEGADFAHMLFGEQAREYYGYADTVYQKIAPLVMTAKADKKSAKELANANRDQGRFIHFSDDNPLPDVLIERANFSLVLPQGEFSISGKELTHQHWIRNKESKVDVISSNVNGSGHLSLSLAFELDVNHLLRSDGKWTLDTLALEKVSLQKSEAFTLQLDSGLLSGNGKFSLLDEQLDSHNDFNLNSTLYSGSGTSRLSTLFIDTVQSLKDLAITVAAKGTLNDPNFSISSPLDKQLKKSMIQQVSKKLTSFKTDVKAGLNAKLTEALGISNKEGKSLVDIETLINDSDKALDKLIHSDVVKAKKKEFEDKQKKKLEDKLKEKLGDLFG